MKLKRLVTHAIVFGCAALALGACSRGGSGGGGDPSVSSTLSFSEFPDYLTYGETEVLTITKSRDAAISIDVSEAELGIEVIPGPCPQPDPLCEEWRITPQRSAVPGDYSIGVQYLDEFNPRFPFASQRIEFTLLPAASAPAAVRLFGGSTPEAILAADGRLYGLQNRQSFRGSSLDLPGIKEAVNQPFATTFSNVAHWDSPYVVYTDGTASWSDRFRSVLDADGEPARGIVSIHRTFRRRGEFLQASTALFGDGRLFDVIEDRLGDEWVTNENIGFPIPADVTKFASAASSNNLDVTLHASGDVWQYGARRNSLSNSGFINSTRVPITQVRDVGVGLARMTDPPQFQNIRLFFGIAARQDGSVWVWLPYRETDRPEAMPRQVPGLADIVQIAADKNVLLARDGQGRVWQLEIAEVSEQGTFRYEGAPVQVPGIVGATDIAIGSRGLTGSSRGNGRAYALLSDCNGSGTVVGWSLNDGAQDTGDGVDTSTPLEEAVLGEAILGISAPERPALTPRPVIGIGDADGRCPRRVLFYKSGNAKGPEIVVQSDTGAMTCDDFLCSETVALPFGTPTNLSVDVVSTAPGVGVQARWDCEGMGSSFTLPIFDRDLYCRLDTDGLRVLVGVSTLEANGLETRGRLGNTVASEQPGLLDLGPAVSAAASTLLPPGASLKLVPTPAEGYEFAGWDGDCEADGSVTVGDRNPVCVANFVETGAPAPEPPPPGPPPPPPGTDPVLTVRIENGPGAGQVFGYLVANNAVVFECVNSNEPQTQCTQAFPAGTALRLESSAFRMDEIVRWSGCDTSSDTDGTCSLTLDNDREVVAAFGPP